MSLRIGPWQAKQGRICEELARYGQQSAWETAMDVEAANDGSVVFHTVQGEEVRAALLRLTFHAAAFEVPGGDTVIRNSEVLDDFKIFLGERPVYSDRAVVQQVINVGTALVCSVLLQDVSFDAEFFDRWGQQDQLGQRFGQFMRQWQVICKVLPEFKVAVADIQTFLCDCRRWLEQVELGIRSSPKPDREQQERAAIAQLGPEVLPVIDSLFGRFEEIAAGLDEQQSPVHRTYVQRHLHPIVLCAPFAYRSYRKPLGYAGDYEVVDMMLRDPQEGSSLFAKVFNVWLLHQGSAAAHRNRIALLTRHLVQETAAAVRAGRKARILSLGCGPAREVQDFIAQSELSNQAHFTLLDFNQETLQHAERLLRNKQREHGRAVSFELVRKSVQQLLRDLVRADALPSSVKHDFIYCAGLLDYLPDSTCKRLMALCHRSLRAGGLLLATNVTPSCPNRGSLELILDWHLVYRGAAEMAVLRPDGVQEDAARIHSDETGVNILLEMRKTNGQ